MLRTPHVLYIFTCKCAFRHSGAAKSAPKTTVFQHCHFQICSTAFDIRTSSEDFIFLTFSLPNVLFATAACNFSTSELQKVLRRLQFFNIFTSECAFRHSRVHFFNIWTYKVVQTRHVLYIFTSECAFRHSGVQFFNIRTYKSGPNTVMFCTFSLPNVLFATAACIFSTLALTKVVQTPHVLYIFTSKYAFHHSGVQFLIYPLTTWLRTRRFNRPTFRLTRHTNHWKNTAFRDFSNIWRGCIFFHLTFALLHLLSTDLTTLLLCYSSAFQLSILSEVSI